MTNDMPEISEMITSFFTGAAPSAVKDKEKAKSAASKQGKKKN